MRPHAAVPVAPEPLAPNMPPAGLRCVWIGPTSDGLAWLVQRLAHTQFWHPETGITPLLLRQFPSLLLDDLLDMVERGEIDRLILACDSRLSYPASMIQSLQRTCPDVPVAVACSSWWDGFRRTGLGPLGHLTLPWYRWWDGWTDWLVGDMRDPLPPSTAQLATKISTVRPWLPQACLSTDSSQPPTSPRWGLVVGNCRLTCQTWSQVGQVAGYSVRTLSWSAFLRGFTPPDAAAQYDWIVWDDSCLNTSATGQHEDQGLPHFISTIQSALPHAQWIAALSLPRADLWLATPTWEQCEWIVKPDSGHGLLRLLSQLYRTR